MMGWDKRREAGDAAEKIADDVIGFFEGVKDSYIEAKEATEGTEQRPSEKMLTSGNFYVTAGKSAVTLGAHAIRYDFRKRYSVVDTCFCPVKAPLLFWHGVKCGASKASYGKAP